MKITKIKTANGLTYIMLRASDGEYCVITYHGAASVEMNNEGTTLNLKPEKEQTEDEHERT